MLHYDNQIGCIHIIRTSPHIFIIFKRDWLLIFNLATGSAPSSITYQGVEKMKLADITHPCLMQKGLKICKLNRLSHYNSMKQTNEHSFEHSDNDLQLREQCAEGEQSLL